MSYDIYIMSKRFHTKSTATAAVSVTRSGRKYKASDTRQQKFGGDAENDVTDESLVSELSGLQLEPFLNEVNTMKELRQVLIKLQFPVYETLATGYFSERVVAYSEGAPDPPPDESEVLLNDENPKEIILKIAITRGGYLVGTKYSRIGRSSSDDKIVNGELKIVPNQQFWFSGLMTQRVNALSAAQILKSMLQSHPNLLWLADSDEKKTVMNQIGLNAEEQQRVLEGNVAYTSKEIEPWNIKQQMKRRVHPKEIGQDWIPSSELRHLQSQKRMRESRKKSVKSKRQNTQTLSL